MHLEQLFIAVGSAGFVIGWIILSVHWRNAVSHLTLVVRLVAVVAVAVMMSLIVVVREEIANVRDQTVEYTLLAKDIGVIGYEVFYTRIEVVSEGGCRASYEYNYTEDPAHPGYLVWPLVPDTGIQRGGTCLAELDALFVNPYLPPYF